MNTRTWDYRCLKTHHYSNYQNLVISFDYSWFLAGNLFNLLSLPWKLYNWYCHTTYSILVVQKLCLLFQKCRIFAMYKCTSGRGTCSSMKSCFCELLSKHWQNNGVTSIRKFLESWSFKVVFWGQKIHVLKILGHKNTYFLMRNLNFWSKFFILSFWSSQCLRLLRPCRNPRGQKK